jgi:hypothetical protein
MFSGVVSLPTGRIPVLLYVFFHLIVVSLVAATFPLDDQEADENFDFAVISSLEHDVVPHLGDPRLSDEVIVKLGQTLQRGSTIYEAEEVFMSPSTSTSLSLAVESVDIDTRYPELGSSRTGKPAPRERFSYWCLDLLFAVCSCEHKGQCDLFQDLVQ